SAVRRRMSCILKLRLLREPQVVITDVPLLQEPSEPKTEVRPLIPEHVEVLVFVAAVHDASIRAINYARSLKAPDTRALYFAFDLSELDEIQAAWERAGILVASDTVAAPFRDLTGPVPDGTLPRPRPGSDRRRSGPPRLPGGRVAARSRSRR